MSRLIFVIPFTLALVTACAPPSLDGSQSAISQAVTDGTLGTQGDVGATVSLFMFGDSGCTGTLIAPRVVATAAHCLEGVPLSELEIVVASLVPSQSAASERLAVASATPHPEYAAFGVPTDDPAGLSDDRDIGVVVLAADAPVAPAPVLHLADADARLTDGTDLVIAGYGLTSADESEADYGTLYVAETPFIRHGLSELLAGAPGSPDTCNGDSGGPAYVVIDGVKHLAGITSRAALSAGSALPCGDGGIYTMIGAFEDFVAEASGGLYVSAADDVDLPPPPPPPEGAGSCANSCGDVAPDFACFCNADCTAFGDCCPDYVAECVDVPDDPVGEGEGEGEEAGEGEGEADALGDEDAPGCASAGVQPSLLAAVAFALRRRRTIASPRLYGDRA